MSRKKILLVDDTQTILMMERIILKKGPYDLVTANDGEEAINKVESERPDLILLDLMMPKMNGFEVCEQVRSNAATRDIPIIVVSTRGEHDNVERAMKCGGTDFVTKPIQAGELLSKVKTHLGGSGA
jgi:PleD family two-component response regulator